MSLGIYWLDDPGRLFKFDLATPSCTAIIGAFDFHVFMRCLIQSTILRAATGGGRPPAIKIII